MHIEFANIEDVLKSLLSPDNQRRTAANDFVENKTSEILPLLVAYPTQSSSTQLQYVSIILLRSLLRNRDNGLDGIENEVLNIIGYCTSHSNRLIRKAGFLLASTVKKPLRLADIDLVKAYVLGTAELNNDTVELFEWLATTLEEDFTSNQSEETLDEAAQNHLSSVLNRNFENFNGLSCSHLPVLIRLFKSALHAKRGVDAHDQFIYNQLITSYDRFDVQIQNGILELSFSILELDKETIQTMSNSIIELVITEIKKYAKNTEFVNPGKLSLLFLWKILSESGSYENNNSIVTFIKNNIQDFVSLIVSCCIFTESDFQALERYYSESNSKIGDEDDDVALLDDSDDKFEYSDDYTYRFLASKIIEELLMFIPECVVQLLKAHVVTLMSSGLHTNQEISVTLIGIIESKAPGSIVECNFTEVCNNLFGLLDRSYNEYLNSKVGIAEVMICSVLSTLQVIICDPTSTSTLDDKFMAPLFYMLMNIRRHGNVINRFYMDALTAILQKQPESLAVSYEQICTVLLSQISSEGEKIVLKQLTEFLLEILDLGVVDNDDPFSTAGSLVTANSRQVVEQKIAETIKHRLNSDNLNTFIPLITHCLNENCVYFDEMLPSLANEAMVNLSFVAGKYLSSISKKSTRLDECEMESQLSDLLEFIVDLLKYLSKRDTFKLDIAVKYQIMEISLELLKSPVMLIRSFVYSALIDLITCDCQLVDEKFFLLITHIDKDLDFDELEQDAVNSNQILFNNCVSLLVLLCDAYGAKITQMNVSEGYIKKIHVIFTQGGKLSKVLAFNLTKLTISIAKLNPEVLSGYINGLLKAMSVALFVFKSKAEHKSICANIVLLAQLVEFFIAKHKSLSFVHTKNFAFLLELVGNSLNSAEGFTHEGHLVLCQFCEKLAKNFAGELQNVIKDNSPKVQQHFMKLVTNN